MAGILQHEVMQIIMRTSASVKKMRLKWCQTLVKKLLIKCNVLSMMSILFILFLSCISSMFVSLAVHTLKLHSHL